MADLEALLDVEVLPSLLICGVADGTQIELPNLRVVEGWIDIHTNPSLTHISMPRLERAGFLRLDSNRGLQTFDFSALRELTITGLAASLIVNNQFVQRVEFPALESVPGGISMFFPGAETLLLPALREARSFGLSSSRTQVLEFPVLEQLEFLDASMNENLQRLELPALQQISRLSCTSNPRLGVVGLGEVTSLDELNLSQDTGDVSIEAPMLRTIEGRISVRAYESRLDALSNVQRIEGSAALTFADASVLSSLVHVGGDLVLSPRQRDTEVALPALQRVEGTLSVVWRARGSLQLPSLEHIGGLNLEGVELTGAGTLGALQTVAGDLTISGAEFTEQTSVFDSLEVVQGDMRVEDSDLPSTTRFENLRRVDGAFRFNRVVTSSLAVPRLESTGGSLIVLENEQLRDFDFTGLREVGRDLFIADNPMLPTCRAQALRDQVGPNLAFGFSATGNDEDGRCD